MGCRQALRRFSRRVRGPSSRIWCLKRQQYAQVSGLCSESLCHFPRHFEACWCVLFLDKAHQQHWHEDVQSLPYQAVSFYHKASLARCDFRSHPVRPCHCPPSSVAGRVRVHRQRLLRQETCRPAAYRLLSLVSADSYLELEGKTIHLPGRSYADTGAFEPRGCGFSALARGRTVNHGSDWGSVS